MKYTEPDWETVAVVAAGCSAFFLIVAPVLTGLSLATK